MPLKDADTRVEKMAGLSPGETGSIHLFWALLPGSKVENNCFNVCSPAASVKTIHFSSAPGEQVPKQLF